MATSFELHFGIADGNNNADSIVPIPKTNNFRTAEMFKFLWTSSTSITMWDRRDLDVC